MIYKIKEYDENKSVKVYKNLHKNCWSIKQKNLVVAYADVLYLKDCIFKVNEKGRQRVISEKRKNVHAYVIGKIVDFNVECIKKVTYNPYKYPFFYDVDDGNFLYNCEFVKLNDLGVYYA